MNSRFSRATAVFALALAPLTAASAQTTTMNVTSLMPYTNYDNAPQTFGDHANLDVNNRSRAAFGGGAQTCSNVELWNAGYSNLAGATFACTNGTVAEFSFQPLNGTSVFLSSLRMGSFNGTRPYVVHVFDFANLSLPVFTQIGSVGATAVTINPNVSSTTGLHLQWGTDWNTGINEITTTVSAVPVVTPEPSSVVLMATGLVGLAGLARRRRRTT